MPCSRKSLSSSFRRPNLPALCAGYHSAEEGIQRTGLYQSYQARLDESTSRADEIWSATQIMQRQIATLLALPLRAGR